ncbi:hypothetical protein EDD21DRAFT_219324 [Dissophora ornata]|nr:R3H and coiled-coil domain-containing protein 1 [Dissophora ornata]KAI8606443.1 hypothetical protein EDD21DRAFT_219324 [Dissophora ornata]
MSESGSSQLPGGRRPPKVGVYVPRHRRSNNDDAPESSEPPTTSSPRQPRSSRDQRNNTLASKEELAEDGSSSRSGNSSGSEVQRRGRGKFMGPGGNGAPSAGGNGAGNSRGNRDHRGNGGGPNNNSSLSSSLSQQQQQQQQPAVPVPAPRHPRGRDFDATVLRRYSDDENRPNSNFSRSSSYNSGRSNNSSGNGNGNSPSSRSSARGFEPSTNRRPDRAEEGSWRREETKNVEDQESEPGQDTKVEDEVESALINEVDRLQLKEDTDPKDETGSSEELEEWELALQDSDEDAIPRIEPPKTSKSSKPHPAEHLLGSAAAKTSKVGNWSDVSNDDMYILELYDFSPSIKTMHLTDMFSAFENRSGGFRIKWIDDTRALVIFESAAVAKQAYIANITNQIARIKPYAGADKESIRNTGNPSSGAHNGVRPAKTDSVARRLVQGALGLRVRRTPEQIAEEKALVQAAKEARDAQRQEQQRQREEMDAVFNS